MMPREERNAPGIEQSLVEATGRIPPLGFAAESGINPVRPV